MPYEVERKYYIDDAAALETRLAAEGVVWQSPVAQIDRYFNHPSRDFASTDEALRIRTVGERHWITYKGPKINLEDKTRQEIELPLGEGGQTAAGFAKLLAALGFREVLTVKKTRREGTVVWRGQTITLAWDEVAGLGTYLELEIQAEEAELPEAGGRLAALGQHLQLTRGERRSYLELLLAVV